MRPFPRNAPRPSRQPLRVQRWYSLGTLTLTAILLLLTGCATTGVNRGDLNLVSVQDEWQMGRQLEQDVNRQVRLVSDRALSTYVSGIGQRIVRQTELAERPWTFHVVADPSVNAFNIPGGHVYVNTGLITTAGSTAELAAVMAHEVAHGVSRHGTERMTKQQGLGTLAGALLGQDPGAIEQLAAQVAATGAVASFSRSDEREADKLGLRYLYEAGYNPDGMAAMFEKLMQENRRQPGTVQQFFSTHPLTEERVRDARRRAAKLPHRRGLVTQDDSFRAMQQRAARY